MEKSKGKKEGERKMRRREEQREVTGRSIRSVPLFESIGAHSACKSLGMTQCFGI